MLFHVRNREKLVVCRQDVSTGRSERALESPQPRGKRLDLHSGRAEETGESS